MIIGALVKSLVGPIFGVIDKAVSDKDLAARIKSDIQMALIANEAEFTKATRDIIVAEAQGGGLQRSWRPITMLSFVSILVNNYIFVPYATSFGLDVPMLEIPPGMWGLLTVGIGGYIGSRTIEKVSIAKTQQSEEN